MALNVDQRNVSTGLEIPTESYSDQPYIVRTDDGAWLCTVTTGSGEEGEPGQHVVCMRSTDLGRTWSGPVDIEPSRGPEASYAVLLKVPGGRVYCFYNHNSDNVREVDADNPPYPTGKCGRVDSLGYYVFKYSDDHGRSWSQRRYVVPVREMDIDRENVYGGAIRFFWNVGRPFVHDGAAFLPLIKVGGFGDGFFTRTEGVLLKSGNILTESDPERIVWETLPDGEAGLRTPPGGGPIAEEQSFCVLSDGSFYCVYRSTDGHPVETYSRDGGHSWSTPRYKSYADGRPMKHPRAANFAWKCGNGNYLYWFHNHGGRDYEDRNPVWLCGGVERDSPEGRVIVWSQPEIVLYDDDPFIRMSYPDLVEADGRYFVTETQKNVARVHEIAPDLLSGLWAQFSESAPTSDETLLDIVECSGQEAAMPELPDFVVRDIESPDYGTKDLRAGFSIDLCVELDSLAPYQVLLDNRTSDGRGFALCTTARGTLELSINDGRTENRWDCDPGIIEANRVHHVAAMVDGGPRIITFVVDGRLCDGGDSRQFGWGRFSPNLRSANGSSTLRIDSRVRSLRLYSRAIRTSEAIANFSRTATSRLT